jgi:hypothetical protein
MQQMALARGARRGARRAEVEAIAEQVPRTERGARIVQHTLDSRRDYAARRSRSEPSCSSSALRTTSISVSKRWDNNDMALLQISEPGGAPDPHQRRIAIGIDLGTTHSLVAAVRHGVAECLPDDAGA